MLESRLNSGNEVSLLCERFNTLRLDNEEEEEEEGAAEAFPPKIAGEMRVIWFSAKFKFFSILKARKESWGIVLIWFWWRSRTVTQDGRFFGISCSPRELQSTLVPRQEQTDGQANRVVEADVAADAAEDVSPFLLLFA